MPSSPSPSVRSSDKRSRFSPPKSTGTGERSSCRRGAGNVGRRRAPDAPRGPRDHGRRAPLPIRIGVNRGSVFAGEVGPPYRRTFTVMGDAVNLAARLMAKAETGQVLSTPELLARSRTRFETVDLEPFYVKGKARPVQAQAVGAYGGSGGGATIDLPLLGREAETGSWATSPPRLPQDKGGWWRLSASRDGQVAARLGAAPGCLGPDAPDGSV